LPASALPLDYEQHKGIPSSCFDEASISLPESA
jgi:hypothetical protein